MPQLIQGTSIELLTGNGRETVENVLIGQPSAETEFGMTVPAYVIGIPKGDAHVWTDRKMRFFGQIFRSIGFPEQGIEQNIPLCWGQNLRVRLLCTNADCTFFERATYRKHVCKGVFFYDGRGKTVSKDGVKSAGNVEIHIFGVNNTDEYVPKIGDIVVPEDTDLSFDTSSQESVSTGMKQFRALYGDPVTVKSAVRSYVGLKPDLDITAG